ncbi:hypothetical protein A3D80_02190 [Candidatus Roizmanbacteria bacterium RIFCSPHIGHO2_02_FULL_40_13b]|uniref:Uncharacterized protein n=1 Tax=Candidatus Roizmanbacteria bacterium RIFCSPHIGHO2_01_FULL_39_24 TaxID=1802032 RepID=A0A1F7GJX0_9BACT|nr:MAG: hypothetical protein A2799_00115 [Candidatus Roizmanbacteria bacterium RIFCSPHIGHO2_01_FULL_39_24]OGK26643.1 MAG: hypothetical protein A3D80_02190 [Candidatus Roizmanbacteria bacterium RIFCSPHIGHO2_02_FULL_40_13b]OGK50091.1 MAG: hypothetical protein A3A56_03975 [Candidatus Roizmanbacteria bacterium RIFCSPLOWO2_01_FULL_40_32]OGK55895.1 MAG: hypothetical protein A3H83_02210 [Candidatus Roizmanbacteria bacterium RIFCSPLOWO2_02_FULL_39_8]
MLEANRDRPNPNTGVRVDERLMRQVARRLDREDAIATTEVVRNPDTYFPFEGYVPLSDQTDTILFDPYSGELAMRFKRRREKDDPITSSDDIVIEDPLVTPKRRKTVQYEPYPSIERTMRRIQHIIDDLNPKKGQTMQRMWNRQAIPYQIEQRLESGSFTNENLDEQARMAEERLQATGIERAKLDDFHQNADQVRRATTLDSLGRVNALRSKTFLGSSKGRGKFEGKMLYAFRKAFLARLNMLKKERKAEREALEQVRRAVHANGERVDVARAQANIESIMRRFLILDAIKVAPYRPAAAKARLVFFGLEGIDETALPMYKSLVGDDFFEMARTQFTESYARLIQMFGTDPEGISKELQERIGLIATIMKEALVQGEQNMVPWTDTDYSEKERKRKWREHHPDKTV